MQGSIWDPLLLFTCIVFRDPLHVCWSIKHQVPKILKQRSVKRRRETEILVSTLAVPLWSNCLVPSVSIRINLFVSPTMDRPRAATACNYTPCFCPFTLSLILQVLHHIHSRSDPHHLFGALTLLRSPLLRDRNRHSLSITDSRSTLPISLSRSSSPQHQLKIKASQLAHIFFCNYSPPGPSHFHAQHPCRYANRSLSS